MTHAREPALVGIAHGTSSPRGQAAVAELVRATSEAVPERETALGFVDVQAPDVPTTLAALPAGSAAVVVPLLLSAGFHVHVDLRRAVAAETARRVILADALGPHSLLVEVLRRRLRQARFRDDDTIVLAAAGSSDVRAVADCLETGRMLATALGTPVTVGFLSAAEPRLADAVAAARAQNPKRRIVVSSYLLAPGYFHDLTVAAGADVTTAPLLVETEAAPPELVQLVLERYRAAKDGASE